MTITISLEVHFEVDDAREAYNVLCDALATIKPEVEWDTVAYCIDGGPNREPEELWPVEGGVGEG